jgi:hypothetical protein
MEGLDVTEAPCGVHRHPGDVRRALTFGATLALALSLLGCGGSTGATQATATQATATQAAATQAAVTQAASAAPTQAPPSSGSAGPSPTSGDAGGPGASVTLSGAIAKTYETRDAAATTAADLVIIAIFEPGSDTCSLSLTVPVGSPPGTYKVGNGLDETQEPPEISALYTTLSSCGAGALEGDFEGTGGTIKITASGAVWSGTFDVTVARRLTPKDVMSVTGSFTGLKLR